MSVEQETPDAPQEQQAAPDERQELLTQLEREQKRVAELRGVAQQMRIDLEVYAKRVGVDLQTMRRVEDTLYWQDMRVETLIPILKRVLPILDDLERAFGQIAEPYNRLSWTGNLDFIYWRLQMLLVDAGVKPIDAIGKKFDPALHEAISFGEPEDSAPSPEGTQFEDVVAEQLLRGYTIEGRLLRSSIVRVERRPTRKA